MKQSGVTILSHSSQKMVMTDTYLYAPNDSLAHERLT